mgnify:FL=1
MKRVSKWIGALLIALCLAVVLFPPFFILFSSLLSEWELDFLIHEVGSYAAGSFLPIRIPPYEVDLHQFRAVLLDRPEILRTLLNTMGYAAITLAGMFLVAPLAAFVFAKLRFKGNSVLFFLYVFLLLLPFQVLCVPLYLTVSTLHLMDTPWAFILPEIFSPLYVFLLRQFMRSIPDSILEAAALDGAGLIRTYLRIILPLSKPALAVCGVLCAAKCWNMIEQPLLFLKNASLYPLSLYIHEMMNAGQAEFLSTCVLAAVPVLLLFLIFNDDLMDGLMQMEL